MHLTSLKIAGTHRTRRAQKIKCIPTSKPERQVFTNEAIDEKRHPYESANFPNTSSFPQTFRGFLRRKTIRRFVPSLKTKWTPVKNNTATGKNFVTGRNFTFFSRPDFRLTAKISNFQFESFIFVHLPRASFCAFVGEAHIEMNKLQQNWARPKNFPQFPNGKRQLRTFFLIFPIQL